MVKLKNISKSFGDKKIIDNFSYNIKDNLITAISGVSGCGKTTLLRIIMKLEHPDSGELTVNGTISAVFQEHRLLPWFTAFENINVVINDTDKTFYWLDVMGLKNDSGKYPSEMSGGMNQRIALARALAYDSDILILDEPFRAFDEGLKDRVIELILKEKEKRTVIMVTHEKDIIGNLADDIIYLS